MDSDSELESTADNDHAMVREQLETYKLLNVDLSKKIQEFKINLNAANREMNAMRNDLMEEQLKSSELRRALMVLNGQCSNFFNVYIANLQACMERTDLSLTLPGATTPGAPTAAGSAETPEAIILRNLSRFAHPFDPSRQNTLDTINEEISDENRFMATNNNVVASTPFQNYPLLEIQNLQPTSSRQAAASATPKRPSEAHAPSTRRISDESSPEGSPLQRVRHSEEMEEAQPSSSSSSMVAGLTKRVSVKAIDVQPTAEQIECFKKSFDIHDSADETFSVESSSVDYGSSCSTESKESNKGKKQKRKIRAKPKEVRRRSNERPKRKARTAIGSMAERTVKSKLRRS